MEQNEHKIKHVKGVSDIMLAKGNTSKVFFDKLRSFDKIEIYKLKEELKKPNEYLFETYVYPHIFYLDEEGVREMNYHFQKNVDDLDKSSHSPSEYFQMATLNWLKRKEEELNQLAELIGIKPKKTESKKVEPLFPIVKEDETKFKTSKGLNVCDYEENYMDILFDCLKTNRYIHPNTDNDKLKLIFSNEEINTPPKILWLKSSGSFQMFFQFMSKFRLIEMSSLKDKVSEKVYNGYFFVNDLGRPFQPLRKRRKDFKKKMETFLHNPQKSKFNDMKALYDVVGKVAKNIQNGTSVP